MIEFFIGPFLIWLPKIFFATVFLTAMLFYLYKRRPTSFKDVRHLEWLLVNITITFRLLYAATLTVGQYYTWSVNKFTKLLLPPHQSVKYFLLYSWTHFWFNVVISAALAAVFYLFLRLLKKRKERFFEEGEVELGFLCALLAGWPNFVIFLPAVFIFVIIISLFRMAVFKEAYTTLGLPFLLATLVSLMAGGWLIDTLGLGMLRI
ncbi:hypothetical protein HY798_03230 [Candidatus Falkowbacteria bacterium]|nr:hypothetical protein [Candidatus Falkowbacteria bacterium]